MTVDTDEDLEAQLAAKHRKTDRSIAARALKETRPIGYSERRKLAPKSARSSQINLKFQPSFKRHLVALAMREQISMTELIERAVALYEQKGQQ